MIEIGTHVPHEGCIVRLLNNKMPVYTSQLAIPVVIILISFLAYGSQIFFDLTESSSISLQQRVAFNACVICTLVSYLRACLTDPGRVPSEWVPNDLRNTISSYKFDKPESKQRRCRKCPGNTLKPPRSHHCKSCQRYI